jgi:putative ABC transport system permease protein
MSTLLFDLRHSFRVLLKRPGLTFLAVLAVAVGIGSVTAIFSVVNTVLLRSLPYGAPERLVMLWENNPARGEEQSRVSPPLVADWQDHQSDLFDDVAAYWIPAVNYRARDGEAERVRVSDVTPNLFPLLGLQPILGQAFPLVEAQQDGERVVILSHGFWQSHFGSDPKALGQSLSLDGNPYTVIGVMPPSITFPEKTELWRPLAFPLRRVGRDARFVNAVGRLKPGVTVEQAQARLATFAKTLEQDHPETNAGWGVSLMPLREHLIGSFRPALMILFAAVGFVLLIACVNVTNLLLAYAAARKSEIALRTALGSSRGRVIRQFLIEGVLIAATGGVLGLLLVYWGMDVLVALIPADIPRLEEVGIDGRVLLFVTAVIGIAGIGMGLAPALRFSSRPDLLATLKSGTPGGRTAGSLHDLLVVAEVTVAMIVLVGAGLLIASFDRLMQIQPGFRTNDTLTFNVQLPMSKYPRTEVPGTYASLIESLRTIPGVRSVAGAAFLPLDATAWNLPLTIEGRVPASAEEKISAQYHSVTPDYFETLGIPFLSGRPLTDRDDAESPGVIVVNQTMARRYWPDGRVLGQKVALSADNFGVLGRILPKSFEVVGVVGDIKNDGLQSEPQPAMYFPYRQFVYQSFNLIVRSSGDPEAVVKPVRDQIRQIDPDLALSNVATMQQLVDTAVARQRFNALLLSVFAAAALLLTAIGIYGVIAYNVSQRTHEIGVRMALGGQSQGVVWMILWRALKLTLIGLSLGVLGALVAARFMAGLLYEIKPTDPLTFLSIALILTSVSALASFVPARRATRVNPIKALRHQ